MRRLAMVLAAGLCALPLQAQQVRDPGVPLVPQGDFDRESLLGSWFEVAQTPTLLERDCHGTTATVETREDSRFTLRIACQVGRLGGPVLPIEGVLVETAPGVFQVRLNRLPQMGNLVLVVAWLSPGADVLALAAPRGEIGWIWARDAVPDAGMLDEARAALVGQGYRASAIRPVPQVP